MRILIRWKVTGRSPRRKDWIAEIAVAESEMPAESIVNLGEHGRIEIHPEFARFGKIKEDHKSFGEGHPVGQLVIQLLAGEQFAGFRVRSSVKSS